MAAIVAFPTSASAFECYNAIRSAQGNLSAAKSHGSMTLQEILADPEFVGLCPAGVNFVIAGLQDAGFRTDILINSHTVMAGGLEKKTDSALLQNGKGIDHLSDAFFETADGLIGEAFGICGP